MNPSININLTVTTPEAAAALLQALGLGHPQGITPNAAFETALPAVSAPVSMSVASAPLTAAPVSMLAAAPASTATPAAAPVSAAPVYKLDDLAHAATPLCDAGRQADLVALLGSFGIQALTQLPKEQYGAFATALRGLGAKI